MTEKLISLGEDASGKLVEVDIDLYQPNILKAEIVLKEMGKLYHQALQDLKWARKRQRNGGLQQGDERRMARLCQYLRQLGGAPDIALTPVKKVVCDC